MLDPVHHLEFVGLGPGDLPVNPRWKTYWIEDRGVHGGTLYTDGAHRAVPDVRHGDKKFFADPSQGTTEVVHSSEYR